MVKINQEVIYALPSFSSSFFSFSCLFHLTSGRQLKIEQAHAHRHTHRKKTDTNIVRNARTHKDINVDTHTSALA